MKAIGSNSLVLCVSLAICPVGVNSASKEDMDLDFLPLENRVEDDSVNNQEENIQDKERLNLKYTLDNTYQVTGWKEQNDQSFDLPAIESTDWSNLTRLGLRSEFYTNDWITFKSDILLNAYRRENEGWNTDEGLRLDIKEAYLAWQQSPTVFFDLGRMNVKSGVATGFNPTDYFKVGTVLDQNTEDVSQLRDSRLGALIIKSQKLWEGGALTLVASPKVSDKASRWYSDINITGLSLQKSNDRSRALLKYTFEISEDVKPEIIYYNESGEHNIGVNFSKAVNKKWLGYVEWNLGKRRNLIDDALLEARESNQLDPAIALVFNDRGESYQQQLALGASYTSASNITTQFEYHYNQAGLSDEDVQRWFDLTSSAENKPNVTGQFLSIRGLAKAKGESLGEHRLFMRSSWIDAGLDDLDIIGIFNIDTDDKSYLIQLEAAYEISRNAKLSFRLVQFRGDKKSDFGSFLQDQIGTFQVTWDF